MKQIKYAYDQTGNLIFRGSFITFPYRIGSTCGLRVAKVLDIVEGPPNLTWEGPTARLKVRSAGRYYKDWEVSSRDTVLKDSTNTIVMNPTPDIEKLFELMETAPLTEVEELKICL